MKKYNRVAVVTGASLGIGAATAIKLASMGYDVIAISRDIDKLNVTASVNPDKIHPYQIDVTDYNTINKLASDLKEEDISVIVNNAGGATGFSTVNEMDPMLWNIAYNTNVVASCHLVKAFSDSLIRSNNSHVFFVTSAAAYNHFQRGSNYSGVKMAEAVATHYLRDEFSSFGIRVTEIIPGSVASRGPANNALEPEDIANAIAWATSLPSYININSIDLAHVKNLHR